MRKNSTVNSEGENSIPHDALIVVCDSKRSLFLRNVGDAAEPVFRQINMLEREDPDANLDVTDRPGRFNDGARVQRSAVQETDPRELEKERFARSLADMLNRLSHQDAYRDLVLIASPRVLGEMRGYLSADTQGKLRLEIDKDLTHHTVDEIQKLVLAA